MSVFGQIDATWPQGQKKNFERLPYDRKTLKGRKDTKRDILGVVRGYIRGF